MSLLSDRAGKTSEVVVLSASTEDPDKAPPGLVRMALFLACASMAILFGTLVFAYYWRKTEPGVWEQASLPGALWISTAIILASSVVFEIGRRAFGRGLHQLASRLILVTGVLGLAFLGSQVNAWLTLIDRGSYLQQNPYSGFFYLFTALHAAHLIGGLGALAFVTLSRNRRRETIDAAAYYWHFLGLLWIALFFVLSH
jgi:cytochrome c oxidase subunit III